MRAKIIMVEVEGDDRTITLALQQALAVSGALPAPAQSAALPSVQPEPAAKTQQRGWTEEMKAKARATRLARQSEKPAAQEPPTPPPVSRRSSAGWTPEAKAKMIESRRRNREARAAEEGGKYEARPRFGDSDPTPINERRQSADEKTPAVAGTYV